MLQAMPQAFLQAMPEPMLEQCMASNARTYARDLQLTNYGFESHLSNARGGAHQTTPQIGERWPILRTSRTQKRHEIPQADRIYVYIRDGFYCQFCGQSGKQWAHPQVQLVLDHVIPWSAGGPDHVNNLRTLCWDCNETRSNIHTEHDAAWNPLPVTYECARCWPELPHDDPTVGPAFCYHHRTRAIGIIDNA